MSQDLSNPRIKLPHIVVVKAPGLLPMLYTVRELADDWGGQSLDESEPGKNRHQALDKRLRKLFVLAGLPYKSAHKFRHGHAVYGLQHAQTMADYKTVSMNLMHEDIKITDEIYAPILSNEVQLRIGRLAASEPDSIDNSLESLVRSASNHDLSAVMRIVAERSVL